MVDTRFAGRVGALAFTLGVGIAVTAVPSIANAESDTASSSATADSDSSVHSDPAADDRPPSHQDLSAATANTGPQPAESAARTRTSPPRGSRRTSGPRVPARAVRTETIDAGADAEKRGDGAIHAASAEDATPTVAPAHPVQDESPYSVISDVAAARPEASVSVFVGPLSAAASSAISSEPVDSGAAPAIWVLAAAARRELGSPDTEPEMGPAALAMASAGATTSAAPSTIINIPVGRTPAGLAITPNGKRVYVANGNGGTISVIDTATNTAIGKPIVVGTAPVALAINPGGTRLYVAHNANGGSKITVINTATNKVVATFGVGSDPLSLAVSPNGKRLYVANANSGTVSVINTANNKVIGSPIAVGGRPHGIAVSPDGTRVYVANNTSNSVSVIDAATNTTLGASIPVGNQPMSVAVAPDGSRVYVVNNVSGTVSVINTATNTTIGSPIAVGIKPTGLAVSPNGKLLFVANSANTSVSVISTATNTIVGTPVTVGVAPGGAVVTPSGRYVYVNNWGTNNVSVIDLGLSASTALSLGSPSSSNGKVGGKLTVTDSLSVRYSTNAPTKGLVVINPKTGAFSYVPFESARHAAASVTAGAADKVDSFTVTATNSAGVSVSVAVSVQILPKNTTPTLKAIVSKPNPTTSVVTIKLTAGDADKDALTYSIPAGTPRGTLVRNADGTLTFTPSSAALAQPGKDTFGITVGDGHGGTRTVSVTVIATAPPLALRVAKFVNDHHGNKVGDGECVALVKEFLGIHGIIAGTWGNAVDYAWRRGTGGTELENRGFKWHTDTKFQDGDIIVYEQGGYNVSSAGHIGIWFQGNLYDQNSGWHATFDKSLPGKTVQAREAGFSPFWNNGNSPPYKPNGKKPVGYLGYWRK